MLTQWAPRDVHSHRDCVGVPVVRHVVFVASPRSGLVWPFPTPHAFSCDPHSDLCT